MILFELTGTEAHPVYQALQIANVNRQYDFLRSIVVAALGASKPFLSQHVIKALNYQVITCLHVNPGEYRPCPVEVGIGDGRFVPPAHFQVPALMDDFVNTVNRNWDQSDSVVLATYVLWRLNFIHPFINGNGRTARAACYFVLCLKVGGLINEGAMILPELLMRDRGEYVTALKLCDESYRASGIVNISPLHSLVQKLLNEQLGVDINAS